MTRARKAKTPRPDLQAVRSGLRDFQLKTVDYVADRLFDPADPTRRFLVADEVGLGKTFVARGIIAETIDRLWDTVPRIDIIYICSNGQIARQNISRLAVTGTRAHAVADRLTMLPTSAHGLAEQKVNLIAFTPGTSLNVGNAPGKHSERVVLYWLLRKAWGPTLLSRRGAIELLRGGVGFERFKGSLGSRAMPLDPGILKRFIKALKSHPELKTEFEELSDGRAVGRASKARARRMNKLIGALRAMLAMTAIEALEPDLVILDEFQRFTSILDGDDDAAQLAQALFTFKDVRVLLLSATPYKMLTLRGDDPGDGDHLKDLMRTTRFLLEDETRSAALEEDLSLLRRSLTQGAPIGVLREVQHRIEDVLRSVMVRTERLGSTDDRAGMLRPFVREDLVPTVPDVKAFLGTQAVADAVKAGGVVDYWKSAPYLPTFLDGYVVRRNLDRAFAANESCMANSIRGNTCALDMLAMSRYKAIDPGHPKMRELVESLDDAGAFSLLWLPPALPTTRLEGAYATQGASEFTKRLVFSAWAAVPRAVASVLSYEAERRTLGGPGAAYSGRTSRGLLRIAGRYGKPTSMPVFTLLMPVPSLARMANPLSFASQTGQALPVDPDRLLEHVRSQIATLLEPHVAGAPVSGAEDLDWYWTALLLLDDDRSWWERTLAYVEAGTSDGDADTRDATGTWLESHANVVLAASEDLENHIAQLGRPPKDLADVLARLALTGPAAIAFRSLDAVTQQDETRQWADVGYFATREHGIRDGAVHTAYALRSLFQQPEAEALVEKSVPKDTDYWRAVLAYAQVGGLDAVLAENMHMLVELNGLGDKPWDQALFGEDAADGWTDDGLVESFAKQVLLRANPIKAQGYRARGAKVTKKSQSIRHHFAVRFGADRMDERSEQRATNVREAFNGPFWPFVLVSTSVGQEGLDFHPYSHAVVHWNLPHNPVDMEQREGRVHRYKGHAVRKNVAAVYGSRPEVTSVSDPWGAMFEMASADARAAGFSDLVPYWVFPIEDGAVIERHVPMLALSEDVQRYHDLVRTLGLYRLAFGQARQQDLLELLESAYADEDLEVLIRELRIDLSPDR